jgi:SAM-dependent methyltransferase
MPDVCQPVVDEHAYKLYAEYTGMPEELIAQAAQNFGNFNLVTWNECPGADWSDKAKVYYETSDEYLFDLLYGSQTKARRRAIYQHYGHWPWMVGAGTDVLEFGGGLGFCCSMLRDEGKSVTYVDVDGPAARFARWYFARCGQADVEQILTPSERLVLPAGRHWDLVFSDSVIEHVPDPAGTVERLAQAVRPGGLLYLIIDAHEVSPAFPMHRHVHLAEILAGAPTLHGMQHVVHDGDGLNAWRAPA